MESFLDGKVTLHWGDCLDVLPLLEENSIDSCVTDPPYHLTSIVKRFGSETAAPAQVGKTGAYARASKGFMGKQWDGGDIAFRPELWAEVYRVLKPGAHLLAFSGTRTYHRMACAIEDAGFEIRDQIGWCFGSGFPKSHDVSKAIDRAAGVNREDKFGGSFERRAGPTGNRKCDVCGKWLVSGSPCRCPRPQDTAQSEAAIQWQGWGTALKPAWEPICLARKPLSESSIAANVLKHGTGGINVDGCRVGVDGGTAKGSKPQGEGRGIYGAGLHGACEITQLNAGRWPANLIHDGSEEVLGGDGYANSMWCGGKKTGGHGLGDSGSSARFFYTAKADQDDRLGSKHPTVKPLDLMQYLVRLITPKGGVVMDPFAGTGTTGEAAWREGMRSLLIERESEYQADIVKRMGLCLAGPDQRRAASVKQLPPDDLPIFGGAA